MRHRRYAPVHHELSYPIALLYLDLAELPQALDASRLCRRAGPRSARFAARTTSATRRAARRGRARPRRRAHRPSAGGPDPAAHSRCALRPLLQPRQLLLLLRRAAASASRPSSPRSPTRPGASATPTCSSAPATARARRPASTRRLHVSPFMGMDQRYDWRVVEPGESCSVHIESRGRRRASTRRSRCAGASSTPALVAPRARALPRGHAGGCLRDLRPRRCAEAQGRAVYPHPAGGAMIAARGDRRSPSCAHRRRPARARRGRARARVFGPPAPRCAHRRRPRPARLARAAARQPRAGRDLHGRALGLARPRRARAARPRATSAARRAAPRASPPRRAVQRSGRPREHAARAAATTSPRTTTSATTCSS